MTARFTALHVELLLAVYGSEPALPSSCGWMRGSLSCQCRTGCVRGAVAGVAVVCSQHRLAHHLPDRRLQVSQLRQ